MKKNWSAKFQAAQQHFVNSIPLRLTEMENLWNIIKSEPENATNALLALQIISHTLKGTAPILGYKKLGIQASSLDNLLSSYIGKKTVPKKYVRIENSIKKLIEIANDIKNLKIKSNKNKVTKKIVKQFIYIFDQCNSVWLKTLIKLFESINISVYVFDDLSHLKKQLKKNIPKVVVVNLKGDSFNQNISQYNSETSIVFVNGDNSWDARLNAVRLGCEAYFSSPFNLNELEDKLIKICLNNSNVPYRVLIVDDDESLARHITSILEYAGMKTLYACRPEELLNKVSSFSPEIILMDLNMPKCSGIEAASIIRQIPIYTNLPIIYLSAEKSITYQMEAMQAGGDEFLQKGISEVHLVKAVQNRVNRFRELNNLIDRDGLTGILNHTHLKLALERELSRAKRYDEYLCFVMLDIDHFKKFNDVYGHPVGDRVIKSLARLLKMGLRQADIAGRYGGEEFGLILPQTTLSQAVKLVDRLRVAFKNNNYDIDVEVTFSGGIASFPLNSNLDSIIESADNALYKAKKLGRNRIECENILNKC